MGLILQQGRKRREDSATNCARTDRTREALAEGKTQQRLVQGSL